MRPVTPEQIRAGMINMSDKDLEAMSLPGLHETLWDEREFLGWREVNHNTKGYLVFWVGDDVRGLMVRSAESQMPAGKARCACCVTLRSRLPKSAFLSHRKLASRVGAEILWAPTCVRIWRAPRSFGLPLPNQRTILTPRELFGIKPWECASDWRISRTAFLLSTLSVGDPQQQSE